jgi:hypothetical protein
MQETDQPLPPFGKLSAVLRRRLEIIGDREWFARDAAGHLEALKAVSEAIEEAVGELPVPLDPQLEHYLARRSYDKALAFVEGRPSEGHSH